MVNPEFLSQFCLLGLAFLLSSLIGLERECRLRSAGLRTHALVGLGAALFMLISKFGFDDILPHTHIGLDPSRIAAQVVSGIGFIGAGLIFVRKDTVKGLTTAAAIWLTAAIGMACGAGLPLLAIAAAGGHFIVVFGYSALVSRLLGSDTCITVSFASGSDALLLISALCVEKEVVIRDCAISHDEAQNNTHATLNLLIPNNLSVTSLLHAILAIPRVSNVTSSLMKGKSQEEKDAS